MPSGSLLHARKVDEGGAVLKCYKNLPSARSWMREVDEVEAASKYHMSLPWACEGGVVPFTRHSWY
jgi:hypothetical protein